MCILEKSNLKKILDLKPLLKNLSSLCETGKSWQKSDITCHLLGKIPAGSGNDS